jgi:hypothetical protein
MILGRALKSGRRGRDCVCWVSRTLVTMSRFAAWCLESQDMCMYVFQAGGATTSQGGARATINEAECPSLLSDADQLDVETLHASNVRGLPVVYPIIFSFIISTDALTIPLCGVVLLLVEQLTFAAPAFTGRFHGKARHAPVLKIVQLRLPYWTRASKPAPQACIRHAALLLPLTTA